MQHPLALIFYERVMPGSQLANRLQDLKYRVLTVGDVALLPAAAKREAPLFLIADLDARGNILAALEQIKADPATNHLPVIAFAPDDKPALLQAAQNAGLSIAVGETAVVGHLRQLLDRALHLD
jgi:CheY-like chemotaxis protein